MNENQTQMIDVGAKEITQREAVAEGFIQMQSATLEMVRGSTLPKGNALETARGAAIMACQEYSADHSAVSSTVGFSRFNNP